MEHSEYLNERKPRSPEQARIDWINKGFDTYWAFNGEDAWVVTDKTALISYIAGGDLVNVEAVFRSSEGRFADVSQDVAEDAFAECLDSQWFWDYDGEWPDIPYFISKHIPDALWHVKKAMKG